MSVIIEDMHLEILPPAQGASGEPSAAHPAEGIEIHTQLDQLELARERAERLACD
ncbi:MAG: hypothetical protein HZB71_03735 [Betaproteobacteria bacterium]|nr:hypothetical protein [Betaproteobacteria bacterium]